MIIYMKGYELEYVRGVYLTMVCLIILMSISKMMKLDYERVVDRYVREMYLTMDCLII